MAQVQEKKKAAPLLPPDEKFWKRYSPHHECLLSCVTSYAVHGLVVGILFLIGLKISWGRDSDLKRPPTMDVVQIEGGGGDGQPEGGGAPGSQGVNNPTEAVANANKSEKSSPDTPDTKFQAPKEPTFNIPEVSIDPGLTVDADALLKAIGKQVESAQAKPVQASATNSKGGTPGGSGGTGVGTGKGGKTGPGVGTGLGGKRTKQQIYAQRWRFDFGASSGGKSPAARGKAQAEEMDAFGFVLIFPDAHGKFWVIRDFKRRPVEPRIEDLSRFKKPLLYNSGNDDSVYGLAQELRLPFVPSRFHVMLPLDRQEKLAEVEAEYARRRGRALKDVNETWFGFRAQNGIFEPIVLQQK